MAMQFRLARGWSFLLKGNYEACQRELDPMLDQIDALPRPAEIMAWWGLMVLFYHCDMGDWPSAAALLPNISYQAEQAKDYLAWCICTTLSGKIAFETGDYHTARQVLEEAVSLSAQYQLAHPALMGWRFIAENELALNNVDVADQICQRALEVAEKPNIRNQYERFWLYLTRAHVLMAKQLYREAGTLLEENWSPMMKTGYTPLIAQAAYQISELYTALAAQAPNAQKASYQEQSQRFRHRAKTLWQGQNNQHRLSALYAGQAT